MLALMGAVRLGQHHATFDRGFSVERYLRPGFTAATRSRRVRAFFFGLRHSRLRTYFVARYYHLLVEQWRDGDFRFLPAVSEAAEVTLFDVGTYAGRNGARDALSQWRETFSSPVFELVEVVNPPGGRVLLILRVGGLGAASGVALEDLAYFAITVEAGMATSIGIYHDKAEALEATGLRERNASRRPRITTVGIG
jgi:hypothetical protein